MALKKNFHLISFQLFATAVAIVALTACKPVPNATTSTNISNNDPQQKLTAEQIQEFARVLTSIGRVEELARVMKSRGATWGTSDPILAELRAALAGANCEARFSEGPSTRRGFRMRVVDFVGSQCPILFSFQFDIQVLHSSREMGRMHLTGSFEMNDALAARNGIKKFEITSWTGTFRDTTATPIKHLETSFTGNAKATTLDNSVYHLVIQQKTIMEQRPTGLFSAASGHVHLTTPQKVRVELRNLGNGIYSFNGDQRIDKQVYTDFVSTLGIVGDAFRAYTNF